MLVALYARVSTTRQAENDLSIPDQLRQLMEWAKANDHVVVAEYVEPGASATNDKRPVFQKMTNDAMAKPPAFQIIIVHSYSRFYRDGIEGVMYERKLKRNGVKLISITQPTSDDSSGEMMRNMIGIFDGYQSQENSKHTSRAMKENARQGFFNGSRAPYGYHAVATDVSGCRGRKKKKLELNDAEVDVVRLAYRLYLNGFNGREMGIKEIAKHLSEHGYLMRGKPWTMQKIHTLLTNRMYMGEYYFNVRDSKTLLVRPPEEWVKTNIPAIIDAAIFERVRAIREQRAPGSDRAIPRSISSPVLLAGLLKCGKCGHRMTLSTGKSGAYRYYKCTSRRNQGNHACSSKNLPMDKVDAIVLDQIANTVLEPKRLQTLMSGLRQRIQSGKDSRSEKIAELERQLKIVEDRQNRLLDAIEQGIADLDETTKSRLQKLKTTRDALLIEITAARISPLPAAIEYLKPSQVDLFGKALRSKLLAKDSALAKGYVNLLVGEIVVKDDNAVIKGSYAALAHAMHQMKMGTPNQVPTFISDWRA